MQISEGYLLEIFSLPAFQVESVEAHEQKHTLEEHIWYPAHEDRRESALFRKNKKTLHDQDAPCYICGKRASDGVTIEIHHLLEWAFANALDVERIEAELGFTEIDDMKNLMPLCTAHHRGRFTGIHCVSYPVWYAQKYAAKGVSFTEGEKNDD